MIHNTNENRVLIQLVIPPIVIKTPAETKVRALRPGEVQMNTELNPTGHSVTLHNVISYASGTVTKFIRKG